MSEQYPFTTFSADDIEALKPAMKVGVLGTVTPEGKPHLTLITTLMAASADQVVWGQFIEGNSKKYILTNPKTGFLIMTLDKILWRGKMDFSHSSRDGKDYDFYNNAPLFRYNAYFGVHTVYYMNLLAHSGRYPLPMNRVVLAALKTMVAKTFAGRKNSPVILNQWTMSLFNKLDVLKFLGYIGEDGYPVVLPVIQTQALDRSRLIFSTSGFGEELRKIPVGASVSILGMALSMEDVLVRGTYQGLRRVGGLQCGILDVDWVYNAMPPAPMQIYPPLELETIREF